MPLVDEPGAQVVHVEGPWFGGWPATMKYGENGKVLLNIIA